MASFSPACKVPKICDNDVSPDMKMVSLTNMNLCELDIEVFAEDDDVEVLDISRNQIKSFPELDLPNLKVLNCEDNSISDVQSLFQFPTLEHLYLAGNPVNVGDRYIVVDKLRKLATLDGKAVLEIRSALRKIEEKLNSQIAFLQKEKYEALLQVALSKNELVQVEKQLARELFQSLSMFSEIPPKFRRYKAQAAASEFFKDVHIQPEIPSVPVVDRDGNPFVVLERIDVPENSAYGEKADIASNVKYKDLAKSSVPSSDSLIAKKSYRTPTHNKRELSSSDLYESEKDRKKSVLQNGHLSPRGNKTKKSSYSEGSMKHRKSQELELDYDPHLFLRCHGLTRDKQDNSISIWRAAFEPDLNNKGKTTDIVATCGGNIVCFINCVTGHVLEHYKDSCPTECFYALAWTVSPVAGNENRQCTILATGGVEGKIHLIYPEMLKCYHSFNAHAEDINTLLFHSSQTTWLFSGGNDNYIHVWDIGVLTLPDFGTTVQKLMTFKTDSNILHLLIPDAHDCLLAACSKSLMIWDFPEDADALRDPITIGIEALCHAESGGIIDGLVSVARDYIAVKVSLEPTIYLLNITNLLKHGNRKKEITPEAVLIWSSCDTSYNYLGSCKDISLLACGDNSGQIWMYDLKKFFSQVPEISLDSEDISAPTVVLPWPDITFEHEPLAIKEKVVINSVAFNWDALYMVACTDTNIVCIWKRV